MQVNDMPPIKITSCIDGRKKMSYKGDFANRKCFYVISCLVFFFIITKGLIDIYFS